jgi:hypothetical protein
VQYPGHVAKAGYPYVSTLWTFLHSNCFRLDHLSCSSHYQTYLTPIVCLRAYALHPSTLPFSRLLNAGYSVDAIAEITLQVEDAKRIRAEHALEATSLGTNTPLGALKALNSNIMDLLSGAAEGTGRTLFLAPNAMLGAANATGQAVGKVGYGVVKGTGKVVVGTGKVATDVVVGTGKLGYDVVKGTGKVAIETGKAATDVVVGTVKGTGKVVAGTGKLGYEVVAGTGKLGYDVVVGTGNMVKSTGRRMSKMVGLGESNSKFEYEDEDDVEPNYGYEDAPPSAAYYPQPVNQPPARSLFYRRSSSDSTSRRSSVDSSSASLRSSGDRRVVPEGKGNPAPTRMSRRGSANGAMGGATQESQQKYQKAKRRGSGNSAVASFAQSMFGRRISGKDNQRARSGSDAGSRRHPSMNNTPPSTRSVPHARSASSAAPLDGSFSELVQMEQFLHYIQDSDPLTVNPIIGNAYHSSSELEYNHQHDNSGGFDSSSGSGSRRFSTKPQ